MSEINRMEATVPMNLPGDPGFVLVKVEIETEEGYSGSVRITIDNDYYAKRLQSELLNDTVRELALSHMLQPARPSDLP